MRPPNGQPATSTAEPGEQAGSTRYMMRERLVSFGDDFDIQTAARVPAFKVDGKLLRVRNTIHLTDLQGRSLYKIQERIARVRKTMVIERDGRRVATIHMALVTPLRDRFEVEVADSQNLQVQGNIFAHEYTITRNGFPVATISKRWFRFRNIYGVEVMGGENHAFVLAIAAAIDTIVAKGGGNRNRRR